MPRAFQTVARIDELNSLEAQRALHRDRAAGEATCVLEDSVPAPPAHRQGAAQIRPVSAASTPCAVAAPPVLQAGVADDATITTITTITTAAA